MDREHLQILDGSGGHEPAPMDVAQSCTLLYRRIAFCRPSPELSALGRCGSLPIANRRYSAARSSRNQNPPQRRDGRREETGSAILCVRRVFAVDFLFRKSAPAATILADTDRLKICATPAGRRRSTSSFGDAPADRSLLKKQFNRKERKEHKERQALETADTFTRQMSRPFTSTLFLCDLCDLCG